MINQSNYVFNYTCITDTQTVNGKMRVKNSMSELHAKIKLGDHLKSKYGQEATIIIDESKEFDIGDFFGGIFK